MDNSKYCSSDISWRSLIVRVHGENFLEEALLVGSANPTRP